MDIEKIKSDFEASECFKRFEHVVQYTFFEFGAYIKRTDVPDDVEKKAGKMILALILSWSAWKEAKAQAVPERTNQTFEDWLSDPENTKVYFGGYRERANEFAHQAWMASLKAKLPKDKILMPRSLDQKHIDYVVHQLAISSGASLISEVYGCLIEAQEPAND